MMRGKVVKAVVNNKKPSAIHCRPPRLKLDPFYPEKLLPAELYVTDTEVVTVSGVFVGEWVYKPEVHWKPSERAVVPDEIVLEQVVSDLPVKVFTPEKQVPAVVKQTKKSDLNKVGVHIGPWVEDEKS